MAAVSKLTQSEATTRFDYTNCYATLNMANAYRYIIGNPYRSELLRALGESLKVLHNLEDPLPKALSEKYPRLERALSDSSGPVALELKGIRYKRLTVDDGSKNVDDELIMWTQMTSAPGKTYRLSFRIKKVRPSDIIAVHDLREWQGEVTKDASCNRIVIHSLAICSNQSMRIALNTSRQRPWRRTTLASLPTRVFLGSPNGVVTPSMASGQHPACVPMVRRRAYPFPDFAASIPASST